MTIHPTAIVDKTAEISPEAEIGPFCFVGPEVEIGAGTVLMHRVSVIERTTVGEENCVYPGVVLGADPQDKKFRGEKSWLHVGDRNIFRENVTVHRGTALGGWITRVGSDCLFMSNAHVAHDCICADKVTLANAVLLGGHVVVEEGVGIGGLAGVHHYVTVGRYAFLGGAAKIATDAPPYMITDGNPSRVRAVNTVGLKRMGVEEGVITWIKDAQRLLFGDGGAVREDALETLAAQGEIPPEGHILFSFLQRKESGKLGRALQP